MKCHFVCMERLNIDLQCWFKFPVVLRLGWSDSHSIGPFVFGAEAGDHIIYVRAFKMAIDVYI